MAMKSGAAASGVGEAVVSGGGRGGADSAPSPLSSWRTIGGSEVALGGLSIKGFPPCGDASTGRGTRADFLLLKGATPSDSSSSDRISKTLFPLSRGGGAGDEAAARGTAAIGEGELGVGSKSEPDGDVGDGLEAASAVTGGGGVGAGGRIGLATGLEEMPALAARASFSAFANIILLEAPITDPTSRQAKQQGLVLEQLCGFTIQEEMRNASNIVQ
ncbi:uncharacterized protein [Phaseolus vulgaris]|uniref:uncharacterized protein n=1 Tax=Phaseolus vulgaris TaxID=3885 RepID=UPI0035CC9E9B